MLAARCPWSRGEDQHCVCTCLLDQCAEAGLRRRLSGPARSEPGWAVMPRPAVLVVDPQAARRKELSRGLASLGYEVIPAIDERQGRHFAAELGPAVVVARSEERRVGKE